MAKSKFSPVDEYGFERPPNFDYNIYEDFMSQYIRILARRSKRWEELSANPSRLKKNNTLKRFVRKGIPSNKRESIWLLISGAQELKKSHQSYSLLKKLTPGRTLVDIIEIDIPRTFPDNIFFSKSEILPGQLYNVLITFAQQNLDVGYCQGLNYIAGLLLLATKNEETTYWLLKTLVEEILPNYYVCSMAGLITDLAVLDEIVRKTEPAVHQHLRNIGMPWAMVSTKWFVCLYAEVLPTETVLRIWDCLFYEGSKILFRVALTLIKTHREEILQTQDLSELVTCFKDMGKDSKVVRCHEFLQDIFKIPDPLSNSKLARLRRQFSQQRS